MSDQGKTMKTVVYERYGPPEVLQFRRVSQPVPGDNEVLVRVCATSVTIGDTRMRSFTVPRALWLFARLYLGIRGPRRPVLGMELAGDIEAVGRRVTRFSVGDQVFASTFDVNFGGYAEYKCLPENGTLALKPASLTYEEAAAAVGGGMTALSCLEKGGIQPGQNVLIYGASGAVGTNAVQLAARHFGARVTGVCSAASADLVKSLGAEKVIDYTCEDFTSSGETYDVIFDAVAKFPPARARTALSPGGIYINVHVDADGVGPARLLTLKGLIEAGKLKPVIDRCYPLAQIVDAHRYVDQGHKKGNVAVTVAHHN